MERFNVFVYGTLKKEFSNHYYLEDSKYINSGFTLEKYQMYASKNNLYPFIIKSEPNEFIYGEVYEVDKPTLLELDLLEDFPKLYLKEKIDIKLDDNTIIKAYIYFKNEQNYKNLISKNKINSWN